MLDDNNLRMKLSIKYILLLCMVCLSTIDVCAQLKIGKVVKASTKVVKVPASRFTPKVNWAAITVHEAKKASEASSKVKKNVTQNLKLPDVRPRITHVGVKTLPQSEELRSLLSAKRLFVPDSIEIEKCLRRFMNYASVNSQSTDSEDMSSFPLTPGQRKMAEMIEQELLLMAKSNKKLQVVRSESEYVYAKLPATTKRKLPSIMLMAHLDVTPEAPGGNIKPIVHRNYQGGDIKLPSGIVLSPKAPQGKHLKECIGKTIITSDGTTLLGADDKSGCTVLMTLIGNLILEKSFEHGDLYFVFSQNEDIGRAAEKFEPKYVDGNPDVVIDVDGDDPHAFSVENFTAAMRIYTFHGRNAHPGEGYANKYGDALTAASYFVGQIPPCKHPSASRGKQGYVHCYDISHPKDSVGNTISDDYLVKVRLRYFDKLEGDTLRQMLDLA